MNLKPETFFLEAIETIAFNKTHREALGAKLQDNAVHVAHSKSFYSDLELARTRASFIKNKTLDNLDKYLIEFESNFTRKGGKVIWAQDNEEAVAEIIKLIEKKTAKRVLKNRSFIFEEIKLNEGLREKKIETEETDFGNYIEICVSYHRTTRRFRGQSTRRAVHW